MMRNHTPQPDDLPARVAADLSDFGLSPAAASDVPAARDLAARLIGDGIVSTAQLLHVHQRSGMGLFLAREGGQITGILAFVPLTAAGARAVQANGFDGLAPADAHVAARGEAVLALYGWGVAAATKETAKRLIAASRAVGQGALAHLPYYARPTTAAGHRLMRETLGFVDVPGSAQGLVWLSAFRNEAAA